MIIIKLVLLVLVVLVLVCVYMYMYVCIYINIYTTDFISSRPPSFSLAAAVTRAELYGEDRLKYPHD